MLETTLTLPAMARKPLTESEKKVNIGVRVAPSVLAQLQQMADADERTVSFMAEKAIREYVERHGGKRKGK